MRRRIVGFHQDDKSQWVADLECGHAQHVRHDPPWQVRPWVLTEKSRQARLGLQLDCVICDEAQKPPTDNAGSEPNARLSQSAADAYLDARMQGLCHLGAQEIADRLKRKSAE